MAGMALSLGKLNEVRNRYVAMQRRVQAIKEDAKEKVMVVVQTAEVGTACFGFSVINGRWNRPEVVGVPADALGAFALHGAGFLMDGDGGKHLHNLGDGALCSYVAGLGTGIGAKMRAEALNPAGTFPAAPPA